MMYAAIHSTGGYLPEKIITNKDLEKSLDTSHDWIASRTGIHSRHIVNEKDNTSTMAAKAAYAALSRATIKKEEIDLIIVATCTPDNFFPSVACYVKHFLKIDRPIAAFDISAACSGFIYALDIAKQYIEAKACKNILVIGSETMSKAVDWTDRSSCILFGDGAGAVIVSASDKPGIMASIIHSQFDKETMLIYSNSSDKASPTTVAMQGNEVFKTAVTVMSDIVETILTHCKLNKSDIDWLIPHQANIRIIQALAKKLNITMEQVITTIAHQGNTSAASVALALDSAVQNNIVQRNDVLLLEAFGGGMTWGAMVIRY